MNSLQLKFLLLDTISRLQNEGMKLTSDKKSQPTRTKFKELRKLPMNTSTKDLFNEIVQVYIENEMKDSLNRTLDRFGLDTVK